MNLDEFLEADKYGPGIPTTIKTMGVNITTIDYLRVLIIEIGSTIILVVVEAQGWDRFVVFLSSFFVLFEFSWPAGSLPWRAGKTVIHEFYFQKDHWF